MPLQTTARRREQRALTLVELMVAATLGAMLLLATASSAGLFGRQVEYLQEEEDMRIDEAMADVRRDVHDAWLAEVPDARHLVLTAPSGAQTLYGFRLGVLSVQRPDGSQGVLHDGLADVDFSAETSLRYREGPPLTQPTQVWNSSLPGFVATEGYLLEPGESLALEFTLGSAAPITGTPVAGVDEQLINAYLAVLIAKLAAVPPASGSLTLHVYRARGPGDGRPEGPSLGQVPLPLSSLPTAVMSPLTGAGGKKNKLRFKNHAYVYGGGGGGPGTWMVAAPPTQDVPVLLASMGLTLRPGYAYALVIQNTAADAVVLAGEPTSGVSASGIALDDDGTFAPETLAVARRFVALAQVTTTTAHTLVERVRVEFLTQGGDEFVATALVAGQHIVDEPWLGAVPGETSP